MGIFSNKREEELRHRIEELEREAEERRLNIGGLYFNSGTGYNSDKALKLSAVYCATSQISNAVASLPINVLRDGGDGIVRRESHPLKSLLNGKPDKRSTHFNFFKIIVESVILKGAAYAIIDRDSKLNVRGLYFVDYDNVTPMLQPDGTVMYDIVGQNRALYADEVLDFHIHTDRMFKGISVLKYAANSLSIGYEADNTSLNFFKSGGNLAGVLKPGSPINKDQRQEAASAWRQSFENTQGKVPVVILPYGLTFESIAVDPKDAQLLESRQFSVEEIARFFCIPPSKLYSGLGKVDAANEIESLQNLFMVDTILPYTQMIKEELADKLFRKSEKGTLSFEFDFEELNKTNLEAKANYYNRMLTSGIMTPNEIRSKLNMEPITEEYGDAHFMQLSYASMKDIASGAYVHGISEDPASKTKTDNKVK